MNETNLTIELLRRIFSSIGAVRGQAFGLAGLADDDHRYSENIVAEYEDKSRDTYPVWIGQIGIREIFVALTNTATKEEPEFHLVLVNDGDDKTVLGLSFDGITGNFLQKSQDKWLPMSILYQLQIAQAFEIVLQEGMVWAPSTDRELNQELFRQLSSLVDHQF